MTAFLERSTEASALNSYARHFVNQVDCDQYDGRMPVDVARDIYRSAVACHAQRCMLDELEPINRELTKLAALSLGPLIIPPAVEEWRGRITTKWHSAVIELLQ